MMIQSAVTFFAHYAELNECAELANHVETLFDRGRVSRGFNVDVAPVSIRERSLP